MQEHGHELTPDTAWQEVRRVNREVQARSRWHGWMWLALAIIGPAFWIGTRDGGLPRPAQFWVAIATFAVALTLTVWEQRRGVIGREAARLDRPLTAAFVVLMVVVALVVIVWDPVLGPAFVALAALPAVPCLVGAWQVLRE